MRTGDVAGSDLASVRELSLSKMRWSVVWVHLLYSLATVTAPSINGYYSVNVLLSDAYSEHLFYGPIFGSLARQRRQTDDPAETGGNVEEPKPEVEPGASQDKPTGETEQQQPSDKPNDDAGKGGKPNDDPEMGGMVEQPPSDKPNDDAEKKEAADKPRDDAGNVDKPTNSEKGGTPEQQPDKPNDDSGKGDKPVQEDKHDDGKFIYLHDGNSKATDQQEQANMDGSKDKPPSPPDQQKTAGNDDQCPVDSSGNRPTQTFNPSRPMPKPPDCQPPSMPPPGNAKQQQPTPPEAIQPGALCKNPPKQFPADGKKPASFGEALCKPCPPTSKGGQLKAADSSRVRIALK